MKTTGKVWKYGDSINTDVIFPGKYTYTVDDPKEMAKYAMEDLDPEFAKNVKPGDIIVAGANFGCGSSREQAVTCLKEAGVTTIIAKTFSRIYYRNSINNGFFLIKNDEAADFIENGDEVTVDFDKGELYVKDKTFTYPKPPDFIREIMQDGGLLKHTAKKLGVTPK